jgi:hypothetical protein
VDDLVFVADEVVERVAEHGDPLAEMAGNAAHLPR